MSGYINIGNITTIAGASHQTELEKSEIRRNVKSFCAKQRLDPQLTWKVKQQVNFQLDKVRIF